MCERSRIGYHVSHWRWPSEKRMLITNMVSSRCTKGGGKKREPANPFIMIMSLKWIRTGHEEILKICAKSGRSKAMCCSRSL